MNPNRSSGNIPLIRNLSLACEDSGVWLTFRLNNGQQSAINLPFCSDDLLSAPSIRKWCWEISDVIEPGDESFRKRHEAFAAIQSEREYQQAKWGENPHSPQEFLTYIQDYAAEALHIGCREDDKVCVPKQMDIIRKVAALCVAAMEQHGAPKREVKVVHVDCSKGCGNEQVIKQDINWP